MIEFGVCQPLASHALAKAQGCDYLECGVAELLPALPDDDPQVQARMQAFADAALPIKAFNGFIPAALKVTGPDAPWGRVSDYLDAALRRAVQVGADVVVWGSGASRHVPDGFERSVAEEQVIRFLHLAGHWAAKHGITIAIEPLNVKESNIVNSVAEGVSFAEKVAHPRVRVLADFYHMQEDDEPLDALSRFGPWLAHVHVADTGRLYPGSGSYPYAAFVAELNKAAYDGRISVECRWQDLEAEIGASVQYLRSLWPAPSAPADA